MGLAPSAAPRFCDHRGMPEFRSVLVWFRRDLRATDHAALAAALKRAARVHCAFVLDREILDPLPDRTDRRVDFIVRSIRALRDTLAAAGGDLIVVHAPARTAIVDLARHLAVDAVFCNRDYEPQAVARDDAVARALAADGRRLLGFKDQVVFERDEILTAGATPFSVFTPYKRAWLKRFSPADAADLGPATFDALAPPDAPTGLRDPTLAAIGFEPTDLADLGFVAGEAGAQAALARFKDRILHYDERRDIPAVRGGSFLSIHLRFGTLSVRAAVRFAIAHGALEDPAFGPATWLSELIWREFYFQILHHHPRVVNAAFKPEYDRIAWETDAGRFEAWCEGRTGYPIVDAAMRQINRTGFMHNRLRMITASFLTKDLGIDWRDGERYFARRLNDYDLAANNGGWQWAASTGCDAQPYFRIFNPVAQSQRFDPQGRFIRHYLPELAGLDDRQIHAPWLAGATALAAAGIEIGRTYPEPIVDHAQARTATLARYGVATGRRADTKPAI